MPGGRIPGSLGHTKSHRGHHGHHNHHHHHHAPSGAGVASSLSVGHAEPHRDGPSVVGTVQSPSRLSLRSALLPEPLDFARVYANIKQFEGEVGWMYLDTHDPQLVTVGAGNMLPNIQAARALPFIDPRTNVVARPEVIDSAFNAVLAMRGAKHPAAHYVQRLNLQLKPEKIRELAIERAKNDFIPKIKKLYPRFDDFPVEAREAIFDIAYNGGVGRPESTSGGKLKKASGLYKFTHLKAAIDAGDWMLAARVSHRKSSRPERNQFVFDLFERAGLSASMRTGPGRSLHVFDQRLTPPSR